MPELPEVESFRRIIEKTSMKKVIHAINLQAPNMLLKTTSAQLEKTLINNSFESTSRHGKFLFIQLKANGSLMLHFGLSGDVEFKKPGQDPPERFALQFHFEDDSSLFFTDTRKMGKIAIVEGMNSFIEERGYGPDVLNIKKTEFLSKAGGKKAAIKTVLMDQNVIAGVGNEYSDEILFETGIHPASATAALSEEQLTEIYKTMVSVIKESVKGNADREKLSHMFFLDNRKAGLTCPNCKSKTQSQTIGGRSSFFCKKCQKLYK